MPFYFKPFKREDRIGLERMAQTRQLTSACIASRSASQKAMSDCLCRRKNLV